MLQGKVALVTGASRGIGRAIEACKTRGARRVLLLPVSAPFHSSLLRPAGERLQARLETISMSSPQIPLVNNVDVRIETAPASIKDALVRQAAAPVRWVEIIRAMLGSGVTHVVECGPGKALAGMTKRISPDVRSLALADRASLEQALAALEGA